MKRLLNVDGYEILTLNRNENKVELNMRSSRDNSTWISAYGHQPRTPR